MAKVSAAHLPDTKLSSVSGGELLKTSLCSSGGKKKSDELMRKHHALLSVQSVTWQSASPSNGHTKSVSLFSNIQCGKMHSGNLSIRDYGSSQRERTQLLECGMPRKVTGKRPFLKGLLVSSLKRTRTFLFLVAAATVALGYSPLVVRSKQKSLFLKEEELLNIAGPPFWVVLAAIISRNILIRSSLVPVLPLVTLVRPMRATAAAAESNQETAAFQRGHIYVSNTLPVPAAMEVSSFSSLPLPEESTPEGHYSDGGSRRILGRTGAAERETQDGTTVDGQNTIADNNALDLHETREDKRADTFALYSHQVDEVSRDASIISDAPHQDHDRLRKLLLTLNNCHIDDDCFGSGRRCIEGRCWGFAGPVLRPFICRPGGLCTLDKLKGHFYGENGRKGQGTFVLKVYRGNNFNVCGRGVVHEEALNTIEDGLGPVEYSRVAPVAPVDKKTSAPSFDAAEPHAPVMPTAEPGTAEIAGADADAEELLDDESSTHVRDGRCLALEETVDCPFTFGSEPIFIKSERVQRDSWKKQLAAPIALGEHSISKKKFVSVMEKSAAYGVTKQRSLEVNRLYYCDFPSALRPQATCDANLGVVPAEMPVGMYIICGCSGTDLNLTGTRCASEEDFAVPIARLLVAGFSQILSGTSRSTKKNNTHRSSKSGTGTEAETVTGRREPRLPVDTGGLEPVQDQSPSNKETVRGKGARVIPVPESSQNASQKKNRETRPRMPSTTTNTGTPGTSATPRSRADLAEAELGSTLSSPSVKFNPRPRPTYQCSVGQLCSILGIRGVALNSGDFFVDFLQGQLETCVAEQMSEKEKHILRLPCQSYAAGSLCMVSLSDANLVDFLSHEKSQTRDAQTVDVSSVENEEKLLKHNEPKRSSPVVESLAGGKLEHIASSRSLASTFVSSASRSFETPENHAYKRRSLSETVLNPNPYRAPTHSWREPSGRFSPREIVSERGNRRWSAAAAAAAIQEVNTGGVVEGIKRASQTSPTGPSALLHSGTAAATPLVSTAAAHSSGEDGFVTTLCGCSSSETNDFGHHCRVPIFLGHLVVHGRISDSERYVKGTVWRHDEAADTSEMGTDFREEELRDFRRDDGIPTQGETEDEDNENDVDTDSDEEIVLRSSSALFPFERTRVPKTASTLESSLLSSSISPARPMHSRSSPWRLLQYITGPAANNPSDPGASGDHSRTANECKVNTDCLSGTGVCDRGKCIGFIPDKDDSRLFRCVEGYWCDVKEGQIEGINISSKFEVIATSPSEPCGTARNLRPNESLFANANKWLCDASSSTSCIFRAGVGHRRNKSHTVEGVRLCGCPHIDVNGDGIPCNHVRDFFVPLGRLGVQECLTNAHCIDNAFAYCIEDHCGGFLVSAAAAGVNAFTCIRNQQCTLQSIAAKSVDQALKVIPVAANFSCGAEAALDPEYVKTSALPCIADVNNDGVCDINLGVNRALGTTRLCGCSGQDLGGNGRACDEAKDFDRDLGLVSNVQCIINQDCPPSAICAKGECVEDDLEPYIVSMLPQNNTFAVPPLSHVDLLFNENIKFGRPGAAILIANLQQPSHKYLITLPPNASSLKRIAAPLLVPGGVLPRFGGGGGAGGAAGGGATAAAEGGGGIAATGLFGRGQSHTGVIANKLAERDGFSLQQNTQQRSSRKLGALSVPEGADAPAEAELTNKEEEDEVGRLDEAAAAGRGPAKVRLKQPQQQRQEELEETASSSLKKPIPGLQREAVGNNSNALLHSGGVKGWRRGGGSATGKSTGTGSSTVPNSNPSNNRWLVELLGQRLRITPDKDTTSLPLGEYRIGIEYGFVSDLVGNYNSGENNLRFTLSKDAGCPYLYVTGFTTENGNCNGLYLPTDPMNEQASWQGGERNAFFIYWKREPREGGRPAAQDGNWIIDTNLEDSSFLAFADLHAHASRKQGRSRALPPSGLWHKWTGVTRTPQEHVQIHCTQQPDRFAASLIAIDPPVGAALQLSATTLLPLHPITLIFNKPMNYGHWAAIRLTPKGNRSSSSGRQHGSKSESDGQDTSSKEVVWYADVEASMRGNAIRVYNKPASEVLPSFSSSSPSPPPSTSASRLDANIQSKEDASAPPPLGDPPPSFSLSAEKKTGSRGKTGNLTRALQKRLFEQRPRVHRSFLTNDATDSSNQHLALLSAIVNPEVGASAAGAPSRAAAEASDADDIVGVVELHVQQPLSPGQTYDFTVQLGALTDLSYNPWGPVESGLIVFHTTGGRCRTALSEENVVIRGASGSSSENSSRTRGNGRTSRGEQIAGEEQQQVVNYAEAYVVLDLEGNPVDFNEVGVRYRAVADSHKSSSSEGPPETRSISLASDRGAFANGEAQDGTKVRVRCAAGYSVHASARGLLKAEETILRCSDGRWQGEQQLPKCFRNCGVYPVLGGAYQMAGDVGGDGVEGEVIDVQCTNTAELLSATGRQAIRCSGGKWDALLVKCGATCPPLGPTLGSKYEVKQVELRRENSTKGNASRRKQGSKHGGGEASGGGGKRGGEAVTGDPATVLVPETGEAKEGTVRRISCAPGSHSVPAASRRSGSSGHSRAEAKPEEGTEDEEAAEEIRCGKDGWEQLHLQCFADCPVEQLAALLGQHGPGLEAAAGNFRDGRHGDRRDITCAVGFAPAAAKYSRISTTCNDGRWLSLSISPAPEEAAGSNPSPTDEKDAAGLPATAIPGQHVAEDIQRPICVPRCAALELPEASYVVTPLPDVRGVDGSTQQQVRVRCAAAAVAVGGPGAATEQQLTCSRAGVWGLLTLQCKAPCRAPLLQLGDRYEMRDGSGIGGTGATPRGTSHEDSKSEVAQEGEELYSHGTERLVGCAPGAAVDGGGFSAAPQKIVCDDGLWQSAYRAVRSSGRRAQSDSSGGTREGSRTGAASVDLKCRRGCGAPPLPQGVQPLLLSPRAVLLQRWQHDAQLLVGCSAGFSAAFREAAPGAAVTVNSGVAEQQRPEGSRQEELLVCRDGVWESLTHPHHYHQKQHSAFSSNVASTGKEERPFQQSRSAGVSPQYRQLQHHQRAAAEAKTVGQAAGSIAGAKNNSLYLTLECRRDCAAADIRRLAQQQHFELQQLVPLDGAVATASASGESSSAAQGLSPGASKISQGPAAALRHGQSLHVACQKSFESLSGLSPETASAISCSHGRLLLPRIVCGRPSCSDGVQNGDETGVDCGGSICSPCSSCSDGIQNNDETGVDCGGSCPPCHSCPFPPLGIAAAPPPVGVHHVIAVRVPQTSNVPARSRGSHSNSDSPSASRGGAGDSSQSGESSRTRSREALIFDEFKSFEETGRYVRTHFAQGTADRPLLPPGSSLHLQCGTEATASGPAATRRFAVLRCMPSGQWLWAADAAAAVAFSPVVPAGAGFAEEPLQPQLICTPPTCFDGVRNGDETGVDCGGSCSRSCASCFNGIQDGEEEDTDCGGRDCEPCSSCSPRLLKPFLLNSNSTFAIVRRGAVVGTSAAAAAGINSSNIPSAFLLDQELAKGILHPLLTGHGQQLQIKCRAADSAFPAYVSGRGTHASDEQGTSSLAAATAGAYYTQLPQQQQPQGVKQPLPLTVHCRHGIWTTPAVAAASALALTKSASVPGQQTPQSSSSGSPAVQPQQQDSWLTRAALEAHQALENFRETCTAYRRSATEFTSFTGNHTTEADDPDTSGPAAGAGGSAAVYGSPLISRAFPNASAFPAAARKQLWWSQPHFAVFAVPDFRVKSGSPAGPVGSSDRGVIGSEPEAGEGDACVSRLIETFRTSLRGECGALAFGSSSLKISSFCSNSCRRGLEAAIVAATQATVPASPLSNSGGSVDACSSPEAAARVQRVAELLQELLKVWCKQKNGNYCFAEAEASFAFVQQLYFLIQSGMFYESELAAACPVDSCFRNNIKHIVLLAQLSTLVDVPQPPAGNNGNSNGTGATILNPTKSARRSPHGSGSPSRRLRQQEQQPTTTDETSLPGKRQKNQLSQQLSNQQRNQKQQFTQEKTSQPEFGRQDVHTDRLTGGSKKNLSSQTSVVAGQQRAAGEDLGKLLNGPRKSYVHNFASSEVDVEDASDGEEPHIWTTAAAEMSKEERGGEAASGAAATAAGTSAATTKSPWSSGERRLLAIPGTVAQGSEMGWDEGGSRRFLSDITNLPQIMDLVCMRVEGHSCAPEVLRVGMENPVLQSPAADAEETQRICMRDPCVLEVVRTFGQLLMDAADASLSKLQQQQRSSSGSGKSGSGKPTAERRKNSSHDHLQQSRQFSNSVLEQDEEGEPVSATSLGRKAAATTAFAAGPGGGKWDTSILQQQHASVPHTSVFSVQPRDVVLGMLMKYWGRTFCHRNVHGALCGGFIFPSKENAALLQESRASYPAWSPQKERRLYRCSCPTAFVGDGDCDVSCFSQECDWDGGDCLATELVFPVYRHLINQVGRELSEPCNPFNAAFTCSTTTAPKKETALQRSLSNKSCATYFSKLAETRGCCLATQLEVLRDLLEADVRILAATRRHSPARSEEGLAPTTNLSASSSAFPGDRQRPHTLAQTGSVNTQQPTWPLPPRLWRDDVWLQLDRSSFFFEYACQQQLDRTCSRGLSRSAYAVEFKIENVDYDELLQPPASAAPSHTAAGTQLSSLTLAAPRGLGQASGRRQRLSAHSSSNARRAVSQESSSSSVSSRQEVRRGAGSSREGRPSSSNNGSADEAGSRSSSGRSRRSAAEARDDNLQGKGALEMEESAGELLLRAEASPKLHEFKRVLREELAAIFSIPAADVIEMRVWRGSADVHAVIDAGWLSNRRSFKEHVESLTADPHSSNSLSARLSAGLTRHLSAVPSHSPLVHQWNPDATGARLPLLVLGLPSFLLGPNGTGSTDSSFLLAGADGEGGEISVTPDYVFVERVPLVQQVRYHPGSAAAAVAMAAPPFGTFGVSELPTESRECIGAEGLHPAEGSSISEAYRFFYKNVPSADAGPEEASQHGNTMVVECNVGHEAIAGESPQELVCNQGRWEPLSSLTYAYSRLQPTSPVAGRVEHEQSLRLASPASSSASSSPAGSTDYLSPIDSISSNSKRQSLPSGPPTEFSLPTKSSWANSVAATAASSTSAAPAGTFSGSAGSSLAAPNSAPTHTLQQHIAAAAPRILLCRRPCSPYERVDPAILRAEFVISGMGSSHGDKRSVFCAPGYSPRDTDTFPSAQQMLTCVNGMWLPPRTLVCEKDFAAVSGSSTSSPCSGALSGLEERYRLTEVPLSSAASPDISMDLANALNARLQPKGVSLQVFKITCARGYTHQHAANAAAAPVNPLQQQQQGQQQRHQNALGGSGRDSGEVYVACLNGVLIGFGTDELFPRGGSAEGHRAGQLAAAFEMRLRQHSDNTITLARRRHAASALGTHSASAASPRANVGETGHRRPAETIAVAEAEGIRKRREYEATRGKLAAAEGKARQLQADVPEERHLAAEEEAENNIDTLSAETLQEAEEEEESGEEADYVQRNLTCEREVRVDPPIEAKPISDTVMVFLCLLVLFALTVFFLTGWWVWNTKKKRRTAAAAETLAESGGNPAAAATEKGGGGSMIQSGGDGWHAENSRQYSEYYLRTTAPGLSQTGGSSIYSSGPVKQKPTPAHGVPAETTCEDFVDVSDGDSHRLLLSRYYWLAAAAAAAGKATAREAAGSVEECDEDSLAIDHSKAARTNRGTCIAVNKDEESADALAPVLLLEQGGKCRERMEADCRDTNANEQQGEVTSLGVSFHNGDSSAMVAALPNTVDTNQEAESPRQTAVLQLLLRHVSTSRLRQQQQRPEQQQQQAEQQQINPHLNRENHHYDGSERVGTKCEVHRTIPAALAQRGNEREVCFTEATGDTFSKAGHGSSKDSLSPVYLRGLPGDHGSVLEIRDQSVLDGKGDLESARPREAATPMAVAAGWHPETDISVQNAEPTENDSSVSLASFQQPEHQVLMAPYQQRQTQPARECGTLLSSIRPASILTVEAARSAERASGLPGQLHHDDRDQLPVVKAQNHREQPVVSDRFLKQRKHVGINSTWPDATRSSQVHMINSRDGEAAERATFVLEAQEQNCNSQKRALSASSSAARAQQSSSRDVIPSASTPGASSKDQLTADLVAFGVEDRHASISTASSLDLMHRQRSRLHSASSNCSTSTRKRGVLQTNPEVLVDAREQPDGNGSGGGRRESAKGVDAKAGGIAGIAKTAKRSNRDNRSSNPLLSETGGNIHLCTNTANTRQVRHVQQQCKEAATLHVSETPAVTLVSEDDLYPEDSASCVGQKGYRARTARNTDSPSACGGMEPAIGSNDSNLQHLPLRLPTHEMYPFSEAHQQRSQRLLKPSKSPQGRRQRKQQQNSG